MLHHDLPEDAPEPWRRDVPDDVLAEACRNGDRSAFAELYARHRTAAFGYALALVGDDVQATDVVSEAFVKVLAQLDGGKGPRANFRSYLLTTLRNAHLDQARRKSHERLSEDVTDEAIARFAAADPVDELVDNATLMRAFSTLPPRWRDVLWCAEVLGEPLAQIAARLDSNANAVGVALFRAREGLRQAYLSEHLGVLVGDACRRVAPLIPRHVRGNLSRGKGERLLEHLEDCERCRVAVVDVSRINTDLGALLAPVVAVLGGAGISGTWVGGSGLGGSGLGGSAGSAAVRVKAGAAAGATALGVAAVLGFAFQSDRAPVPSELPATIVPQQAVPAPSKAPRRPRPSPSVPPVAAAPAVRPPVPAGTEQPRGKPRPTPSPAVPLRLEPLLVSTVRTSSAHSSLIGIRAAGSRPLRLRLELENAAAVEAHRTSAGWTCAAPTSASGSTTAIDCTGNDAGDVVLSVTWADPTRPLAGSATLTDGDRTSGRRVDISP
ncbi:sigma-70 family RNA polymerase sigma factor [Nocardioides marmoriginsengisoli]|uniref:Sigma-70 family RNA polymerase sigma factor n=1 Tax=Nocardioides marmoriginsengisoli TaxID=661483 RepID=A0A3N0CNN0_9ACTN|nr:sigma-70 family RNA polymerase sigma factor [Nocardioides marmoriginsengisoli]RNL65068.1 sigma-70 family RNA polymerase sigma factor [Nocardioides marmoriginsengisoli]